MIKLDIFSDPICPWCYLGKTLLDRALESRPDHPFVIEWHPFQLNPQMPHGGMPHADYLEGIFGSMDGVRAGLKQVMDEFAKAGAELDLAAVQNVPNTLDAHRLIHWAGIEGKQTAAVSALMRAHFREGKDIGDPNVLSALAGQIGLDAAAIARLLATDADTTEIEAREAHSRKMGVRSVPTFVVGNRHVVTGAQPTELWLNVIAELAGQDAPVDGEGGN